MDAKASTVFGAIGALFFAGAIAATGAGRLIVFVFFAVIFGWLAARSYYRESVASFENCLADLAPQLTRIDKDWRRKARRAAWPDQLRYSERLRLSEWAAKNIPHLQSTQLEVLDIARKLYADDAFLDSPIHKKSRRTMRQIADLWCEWGRWLGHLDTPRERFYADVLESNREALVMLAYVEIALAERLASEGASSGVVGRWSDLGEQHPSFCRVPISATTPGSE